jgi:hypothetical protein
LHLIQRRRLGATVVSSTVQFSRVRLEATDLIRRRSSGQVIRYFLIETKLYAQRFLDFASQPYPILQQGINLFLIAVAYRRQKNV